MDFTREECNNADLRRDRLWKTLREALAEDGKHSSPAGMDRDRIGRMFSSYYTSRPKQLVLDLEALVEEGKIRMSVRYYA